MHENSASSTDVNVQEIRVFLALAEELHFRRAAERLYLSQPHVSRTLAALERKLGGSLFVRGTHGAHLTPLGLTFLHDLRPAFDGLVKAIAHARATAAGLGGELVIGCTATTATRGLSQVVGEFAQRYPECHVNVREVPLTQPFKALSDRTVDILAWWRLEPQPNLTFGPVIEWQRRAAMMRIGHPLAAHEAVAVADLADYGIPNFERHPGPTATAYDVMMPTKTDTGRNIPRIGSPCLTLSEAADLVARTDAIHPTMEGAAQSNTARTDLIYRPVADLPPVALVLIWLSQHDTPRIRAFAATAAKMEPLRYPQPSAKRPSR